VKSSILTQTYNRGHLSAFRAGNQLLPITIMPGVILFLRDRYRIHKALRSANRMSREKAN
jgi:hypothetical protein